MHRFRTILSLGSGRGEVQDHIRQMADHMRERCGHRKPGRQFGRALSSWRRRSSRRNGNSFGRQAGAWHRKAEFTGQRKRQGLHRLQRPLEPNAADAMLAGNSPHGAIHQGKRDRPMLGGKRKAQRTSFECGDRHQRIG